MTERKMTLKGFLHKSGTKAANSASAFIAAHREFLQTGELALFTTPILLKVDSKEVMPTPALEQLKQVVLAHHLAEEIRIGQEKLNRQPEEKTPKGYVATVYNAKGEVIQEKNSVGKVVDLTDSFDNGQRASDWCDRRLFDQSPGCFAVVVSTKLFKKNGDAFTATILRDDAIGRIEKKKKGPVMKAKPKETGRLSFGVKAKESKASFSHG